MSKCFSERMPRLLWVVLLTLFLTVETVLGVLLQVCGGLAGRIFSWSAVILACLFCILFFARTPRYLLTQAALLCTVGADWFLVICDPREQLPAMLLFSGAQLAYFLRLLLEDPSRVRQRWHVALRVLLSVGVLLLTLLVLGERADAVALVSMFYYANLILNLVFSFLITGVSPMSVGFVLFLLCDTLIGISSMGPYLSIPEDAFVWRIIHPGFDLAWAFYLPSQVLLSLSACAGMKKAK